MSRSLTLQEAAQLLRVHPITIRRRVLRGELPHFRVAGLIRLRIEDLEKFLVDQQSVTERRGVERAGGTQVLAP